MGLKKSKAGRRHRSGLCDFHLRINRHTQRGDCAARAALSTWSSIQITSIWGLQTGSPMFQMSDLTPRALKFGELS